jgi:DNA topoisomerase-1
MSLSDYSLIVCEKPDAARKVTEALAEEDLRTITVSGVEAFTFKRGGSRYVVCSASGHLYGLSDSISQREVYPVFDLEWYPTDLVDKKSRRIRQRIASIRRLAEKADSFINACDYDAEGETIGDNILRYACGGKEKSARRARFSTLTKDELVSSFDEAKTGTGAGLAEAGRTRHVLDFLWGINLSRALSTSVNSTSPGYRTISMGRVQGPTLGFVVQREIEIRSFIPLPYWSVTGLFEKDGVRFEAPSLRGRFMVKSEAESVRKSCEGKTAVVTDITKSVFRERPPPPFNTGDLQKEAYRLFGFSPSRTLQVAERLYLNALISYPRTSSQKLPRSIGYKTILTRLGRIREYADDCAELSIGERSPREGERTDFAHPAIHPTGDSPRHLPSYEAKVFDLIVRRFLACFGDDAVRERSNLKIDAHGNEFGITRIRTLKQGWMKQYGKHSRENSEAFANLLKGDVLTTLRVDCEERLESPPPRYNQSTLLERMEQEEIGTKATRAETITTLVDRGYATDNPIEATELGISLLEMMQEYCPKIVSTELTRETERELEDIESGKTDGAKVIENAITILSRQIELLKSSEANVGAQIGTAAVQNRYARVVIGRCPTCKAGDLVVIRSRKTRKRFVGCTNYPQGCRASAPLPQRGYIKPTAKPCPKCGWPVIFVRMGRYPWKLCVNLACESKVGRVKIVQNMQKSK